MRLRYVRCYGGPLDLKRVRVCDPPPPYYRVPKPSDPLICFAATEPSAFAPLPRVGEYILDRRTPRDSPAQARRRVYPMLFGRILAFDYSTETAYRWDGWK